MKKALKKKSKHIKSIYIVCWAIMPVVIAALLVLDGIGIYHFNSERLLVIGLCILVALIPFFSEITIKNISFKKEPDNKE